MFITQAFLTMKKVSVLIFSLVSFLGTFAQTSNILESIGINDISTTNWIEKGDLYYCIRYRNNQAELWSYNKFSLSAVDSQVLGPIAPDSDTLIDKDPHMVATDDGFIHVVLRKRTPTSLILGSYYAKFDFDLNPVIEERWIDTRGNRQHLLPMHNGGVIFGTNMSLSTGGHRGFLHVINNIGDLVLRDTVGISPHTSSQILTETVPYTDNRYLVSGYRLTGPPRYGFYIADSMMNIIDTFALKMGSSGIGLFEAISPNIVALPSGSTICARAGCFVSHGYGNVFTKQSPATRFTVEKTLVFDEPFDSQDICHLRGGIDVMEYNKFDNSVYLVSGTHSNSESLPSGCNDPRYVTDPLVFYNHRYAEIISVDTNLNLKWCKYLRFDFEEGQCAAMGYKVAVPDGREGVLFTGSLFTWFSEIDTLRQFVYHITEDSEVDSTILGEPVSAKSPLVEIRDRIKLYPNPAQDLVRINDIKSSLRSVSIIDVYGRVLLSETCSGADVSIDISALPAGNYVAKVYTKNGEASIHKFVKIL